MAYALTAVRHQMWLNRRPRDAQRASKRPYILAAALKPLAYVRSTKYCKMFAGRAIAVSISTHKLRVTATRRRTKRSVPPLSKLVEEMARHQFPGLVDGTSEEAAMDPSIATASKYWCDSSMEYRHSIDESPCASGTVQLQTLWPQSYRCPATTGVQYCSRVRQAAGKQRGVHETSGRGLTRG